MAAAPVPAGKPQSSDAAAGEDLIIAAMEQDVDAAKAALGAGADPNYTNDFGITPLHVSCGGTGPPEMLELLLSNGAKATSVDSTGWFPLVYAASSGQTKLVRVLLAAGGEDGSLVGLNGTTSPPWKPERGPGAGGSGRESDESELRPTTWTPLSRAAYRGNLETVGVLLAAGARPDLRAGGGTEGPSPLPAELARGAGHVEVAAAIEKAGAGAAGVEAAAGAV